MASASSPESAAEAAAVFDPLRSKLSRLAYRMLGSVADAEDIVQEAFIRWLETDRGAVRIPEAFLRRVVTRLCSVGWRNRRDASARPIGDRGCRNRSWKRPRSRSTTSPCR